MKKISFTLLIFFSYFLILIFLSKEISFFRIWFYVFIWWGYILIFDYFFLKNSGKSIFFKNLKEGIKGIIYSVFLWNIFEIYNIFLKNWNYHNLPGSIFERWLGYFLGFGTVIYGIYISTFLVSYFLSGEFFLKFDIYSFFSKRKKLSFSIGVLFIFLPIFFSRYFFPVIWLSFIFIFIPTLDKFLEVFDFLDEKSKIEKYNYLLIGGLFAGFLSRLPPFGTTSC